jgi:hypothetical protein
MMEILEGFVIFVTSCFFVVNILLLRVLERPAPASIP